jgi:hypothetical protein
MVANWFLCHMHPEEAEECLRNLARLVKPGISPSQVLT